MPALKEVSIVEGAERKGSWQGSNKTGLQACDRSVTSHCPFLFDVLTLGGGHGVDAPLAVVIHLPQNLNCILALLLSLGA